MIDFDKTEEKVLSEFKGGRGCFRPRMVTDELNKIMLGKLEPGCSIGEHVHDTSSEIIFFISGSGSIVHNGKTEPVSAGLCHYCKMGDSHSLINDSNSDLLFYAVVPTHRAE